MGRGVRGVGPSGWRAASRRSRRPAMRSTARPRPDRPQRPSDSPPRLGDGGLIALDPGGESLKRVYGTAIRPLPGCYFGPAVALFCSINDIRRRALFESADCLAGMTKGTHEASYGPPVELAAIRWRQRTCRHM